MSKLTFRLEAQDEPDVLVRIIQVIHRRGGHIRSLQVEPDQPWAIVRISAEGIKDANQIALSLEKLVAVHRAQIVIS
jgi:acetolactate synthase regulatory subunit